MKLRLAILAMVLCAASWITPTTAVAQPIQGVYVGAGVGPRIPLEFKNTALAHGFTEGFDTRQNTGYDGRFSLGYALGEGWRFEAEGTLGASSIKGITGAPYTTTGSGTVRNLGIMANALFDLDIGSPWVFPYLGAGAGYQSTHLAGFTVTRTIPSASFSTGGEAGGFAAQAIAGLSFPVPNMPGLSITADYRMMEILGGQTIGGTSSVGPSPGSIKLHTQFNQGVIIGVRYAFNTPMPAGLIPPAAAAVGQPRSFLVLFDLGSAALDERARGVVSAAAQDAAQGKGTRVEVAGNADTSGQPAANQVLSERRAQVVAAALIRAGVPKDAIAIEAFGDTKPAVPTGPGVARAENRRVEIVVR